MHRQQIETRNSGDESMIAYLKSKSSRKVQLQQESVLDQAKFNINKCSSYIDRKEQFLLANMLVNNNQKSSKKNIKKLGQRISNKFKKLIHANKASSQEESTSIRLVNFNYKETANVEMGSVKQLKRKPSLRLVNTERRRHSVLTSRTSLHSNGSTSSGSSVDQFETNSQLISHLFSPQMGINRLASTPLTSTHHTLSQMPFLLYDTENNGQCTSSCCCDHHSSSMSSQAINMALFMDQSTQVPVDSPVLIESTFNNSSLSNLSDDLIIVEQQQQQTNAVITPQVYSSHSRPMSASMRPQNGSTFFAQQKRALNRNNITPWL